MTPGNPAPAPGTPRSEVEIDRALVAELLADQHPDLARLPLVAAASGWDNVMFRLGAELAVRLPRRAMGAPLLVHEQVWLPRLAPRLPLAVPAPCRIGAPGRGYPWAWSVVPWLEGVTADQREPQRRQAEVFAAFLRALHQPAPADAPQNPVRGGPLLERAPHFEERLGRLEGKTDLVTPTIRQLWERALAAPLDASPTWLHGDLHPRNVLVDEDGTISAVVDWGDMCAGDRAGDLAALWMLFAEPEARRAAMAAYGEPSEATLLRAQGWAIHLSVAMLDAGLVDNPPHAEIAARTLRRLDAAQA